MEVATEPRKRDGGSRETIIANYPIFIAFSESRPIWTCQVPKSNQTVYVCKASAPDRARQRAPVRTVALWESGIKAIGAPALSMCALLLKVALSSMRNTTLCHLDDRGHKGSIRAAASELEAASRLDASRACGKARFGPQLFGGC
jgi:hypothetical protein